MSKPTPQDEALSLFDRDRPRLRAIAYRMLGSTDDADDALQDAWVRVSRADLAEVRNLEAWLTTVVARVCLNQLRTRQQRREQPLSVVPDPIISPDSGVGPEDSALLADDVGLALLVVLESLDPAQRLAFVLHDMFGVPFGDIAPLLDRTPEATRQLASRARRRVRGRTPVPDPDLGQQRVVVDAFLAAARDGDFEGLVAVLHPDVVLRSDGGTARPQLNVTLRGPESIARQAILTGLLAPYVRPVLVNGTAGVLVVPQRAAQVMMSFIVSDGRIAEIDVLADPVRLARIDPDSL